MSSSAVATCVPFERDDVLADADDGRALEVRLQFWASGSTMFFCTNRISPVAEKRT